jgi:hypothetical protein
MIVPDYGLVSPQPNETSYLHPCLVIVTNSERRASGSESKLKAALRHCSGPTTSFTSTSTCHEPEPEPESEPEPDMFLRACSHQPISLCTHKPIRVLCSWLQTWARSAQ